LIDVTKKLSTAILGISLVCGSVAGQKKNERPPVAIPNEFRGAESTGPTDQASIGDLKWFEIFKDDELQKMVRTAMVQNYDLRLAVARINAARANLGLARSDQLPQFAAAQISRLAAYHRMGQQVLSDKVGGIAASAASF
jgi:outer membrane protein, multidrug efflux system